MIKCTRDSFNFPEVKKRTIEMNFEGGEITSNGGVMLLRQANKRIGLNHSGFKRCTIIAGKQGKLQAG